MERDVYKRQTTVRGVRGNAINLTIVSKTLDYFKDTFYVIKIVGLNFMAELIYLH